MDDKLSFLENAAHRLHEINFGKDGIIPMQWCGDDYNHDCWVNNGCAHKIDTKISCCNLCKDFNDNVLNDNKKEGVRFTNVSHGTHMLDFLAAHGESVDMVNEWNNQPVVFVMENPSNRARNDYYTDNLDNNGKCPTKSWYWLNADYHGDSSFEFPNYFVAREYGRLVYSIMKTFHIANGYLTNLVKCGVGVVDDNGEDTFYTTDKYNAEIVNKCIKERLQAEIVALQNGKYENKDVIIFAFGKNTYDNLKYYLKDYNNICFLPHPASRQITDEDRRFLLLTKVFGMLNFNGFYKNGWRPDIVKLLDRSVPKVKITKDKLESCVEEHEKLKGKIKKGDGYSCNKITYYIEEIFGNVSTLTLREKFKKGKNAQKFCNEYDVVWVSYDFVSEAYYAYCGKNDRSDTIMTSAEEAQCDLLKTLKSIVCKIKEK